MSYCREYAKITLTPSAPMLQWSPLVFVYFAVAVTCPYGLYVTLSQSLTPVLKPVIDYRGHMGIRACHHS